jgi:hypothetical protein
MNQRLINRVDTSTIFSIDELTPNTVVAIIHRAIQLKKLSTVGT